MRKESKADTFQRQISALRQQLGGGQEDTPPFDDAEPLNDDSPAAYRPPVADAQPAVALRGAPAVDAATGVIATNSHWNGNLRSQGSVHVLGRVEGELTAEQDIYVAEGAEIDAIVRAMNLVVAGSVAGTVECAGRLEVMPTGHVSGDVTSPSLVVHDGARLTGKLRMQSPLPPDGAGA